MNFKSPFVISGLGSLLKISVSLTRPSLWKPFFNNYIDFCGVMSYRQHPEGVEIMDSVLFDTLEQKLDILLEVYGAIKQENAQMREEIHLLRGERDRFRARIDDILRKLEGI